MNTLIFSDKNASEVLPYSVEFLDRLLLGETIVTPLVSILVFSGTDPTPDNLLVAPPSLNLTNDTILFQLQGGVPGCIYVIVVSAIISSSNIYMKVGHLAIVASDPFASTL